MRRPLMDDYPVKTCCFFKIILFDITPDTKLMIPRKFARKYEKKLHSCVSLKDPNGLVWPVDLENHKGEVFFYNGLLEFARFYSIHLGHMLVFKYQGHSEFEVLIFDPSSTEMDYPLTTSENFKLKEVIKVRKSAFEIAKSTTSDLTRTPENTVANFASKDANVKRAPLMPKLQQEKAKGYGRSAIGVAKAFKSKNPIFVVAMKKSHVDGKRRGMVLRKVFEECYEKWKDNDQVTLQVEGNTWLVNCDMKWNRCRLSSGWHKFAQDNSLSVNDVCVFELINPSKKLLQIFIYRRAAKQTKCNTNNKLPRVRTEAEDSRVVRSYSSFKPKNCFLTVELKPSYMYGGSMSLSKKFVKRYITKDHCDVVLQVSHGRTWSVKCRVYSTDAKFSAGWMEFVRANNLAAGDVCVFELLSSSQKLLNVVIFPSCQGVLTR